MTKNDKLFKGILIVIGSLMLIGYGLVYYLRLGEPVFLQHDYELRVAEDDDYHEIPFNLNYITNTEDDRVVTGILFPQYPDLSVAASEHHFSRLGGSYWHNDRFDDEIGTDYGRYTVRTIFINVMSLAGIDDINDVSITEATILFSDSTQMTVDIGEIRLYTEDESNQLLERLYEHKSSEGFIEATYRIYDDLKLSSVEQEHLFTDPIRVIKINEVDYSDAEGLKLEKNDILSVQTIGESSEESIEDFTLRNYFPRLTLTTTDGDEINPRMPNSYRHQPDYSFSNLYNYLRERGEL